jgi:hypothetical protein
MADFVSSQRFLRGVLELSTRPSAQSDVSVTELPTLESVCVCETESFTDAVVVLIVVFERL